MVLGAVGAGALLSRGRVALAHEDRVFEAMVAAPIISVEAEPAVVVVAPIPAPRARRPRPVAIAASPVKPPPIVEAPRVVAALPREAMPPPFVVVVDAYPSNKFKGNIRQIRNAPVSVQNVVTYDAVIDVENPDLELKPGMTANASVVYSERVDVLAVPNAALRFRPPASLVGSASPAPSSSFGGGGGRGGRRGAASAAAVEPPVDPAASAMPVNNTGLLGSVSPLGSALPVPATSSSTAAAGDAPPPRQRGARGGSGDAAASGVGTDRRSLWVMRGGKPTQVQVRTGLTDGTVTEILEGDVHEGDLIVIEAVTSDDAPLPASSKPGTSTNSSPRMRF